MDLHIQDQLNTEFAKDSTKYIFWFDDKAEYEDEVSEVQIGDVKLHILDGTNWLYSKYLLNERDTKSKYLIYVPFPRPSDAENPLADIHSGRLSGIYSQNTDTFFRIQRYDCFFDDTCGKNCCKTYPVNLQHFHKPIYSIFCK